MEQTPPQQREELENIPKMDVMDEDASALPFDIRNDAMKEAALSFGARGGLAWQTFMIRQQLDQRASYMDRIYDFRTLLIPAPSGLLIEPPVISEEINAMLINTSGSEAAVSDRIYNINKNARIVSTARSWRNYLERTWGTVAPPPDILRPNDEEERARWVEWIRQGWEEGVTQADQIFEQDLNQLATDYQGMVRYRVLLAQGMVSPPYTLQTDRGVTGGGTQMRVGDRAVQITGMPSLMSGSDTWQPANR
ncbi:MAG: type IV secretory system conjugative DNA transfer family protein [Rhodospirillales bacterium]|nr:type IV secretory system conjugative DNA transfer family protein [Rhodospirillales bacterium]